MDENQDNNQLPNDQNLLDQQDINGMTAEEEELSKVLDNINQQVDQQAALVQDQEQKAADPEQKEMALEDDLGEGKGLEPMTEFSDLNKQLETAEKTQDFSINEQSEDLLKSEGNIMDSDAPENNSVVDSLVEDYQTQSSFNQEETPIVDENTFEQLKKSALKDLRPLIDKLNLSDQEKFDIHLLLIRSTDDKSLLEPAYQCAREIEDESKKAQALLDIIKEIDYFASKALK